MTQNTHISCFLLALRTPGGARGLSVSCYNSGEEERSPCHWLSAKFEIEHFGSGFFGLCENTGVKRYFELFCSNI